MNAGLRARVEAAVDEGRLSEHDLERLLERSAGRPAAPMVLAAAGLLVAYIGLALGYGLRWDELSPRVQLLTPFIFPAIAYAAAVAARRLGAPRWCVRLAALVGHGALGLAFAAAFTALPNWEASRYAALAGWAAVALVALLHLALDDERVTALGLAVATPIALACSLNLLGLRWGWALAATAVVAAVIAGAAARLGRPWWQVAACASALTGYAACLAGIFSQRCDECGEQTYTVTGWHVALSLLVVATFVLGLARGGDALLAASGVGVLAWLVSIDALNGGAGPSGTSWPAGVVGAGLALAGVGAAAGRRRRRARFR